MSFQADSKKKSICRCSSFLLPLLLFTAIQMGCGSTLRLESTWRDREINIDGKSEDWSGVKYYFEDISVSVGLMNDERNLYVSLLTDNRMVIGQIMMRGLTFWLDPKGGKNKTFGIKFPIGRQQGEMMTPESMEKLDREELMERFQEALAELEVLGPNQEVVERLPVDEAKGIDVRIRTEGGSLVYEIEVPLSPSEQHPYAVGAQAGDTFGFGFDSPKLEMQRPGGMPGGGRGGGPPRGVGGMGRMPPGGMGFRMPERLKIWAIVELAPPNKGPAK
jgi:hypothetical protein